MPPQHPIIATALADQRQADLRWRAGCAASGLSVGRLGLPAVAGGGRPPGRSGLNRPVVAATQEEAAVGSICPAEVVRA